MKKSLGVIACLCAAGVYGAFVDVEIERVPVTQVPAVAVAGKAKSALPPDHKWKLVWHDEFDGTEIDRTKWMCRTAFWGQDFPAFTKNFEGVVVKDGTLRLHLIREGDSFRSPHLQTGSLSYDVPKDTKGFWPFGSYRKPLFMHTYGYYEIRCRQPKNGGWHSAFWLQAPGIGSTPNPEACGVETDIMENYLQHSMNKIVCGNGWGGYGRDSRWFGHFRYTHEKTEGDWHTYGVDWSPEGYTFYADGKVVGIQDKPVSHTEQFILVSTECRGYRNASAPAGGLETLQRTWGKPDPRLFDAVLPDCFEVDYVRVWDRVPEGK